MAAVRCSKHPMKLQQVRNNYIKRVEPLGYPITAAICGRSGCYEPGLVWITEEELNEFNKGKRCFGIGIYAVKIKVSNKVMPLPPQN